MAYNLGVWSEREEGDWEACVISSYLEALVYGGVTNFPLGVYTQAEREALELVPDEPQDYATTDTVALARYGVKLRPLSVGTIASAIARPGMGLLAAGFGGVLIPTTAPIHSVFFVGVNATEALVYDPLAPNQSAGVPISVARVVGWVKGAGANDAREVAPNEFAQVAAVGDAMIEALTGYAPGTMIEFAAGKQYQFFNFEGGSRTSWAWTPPESTAAPAEGLVDLAGEGPAHFIPKIWDGGRWRANAYLPVGYAAAVPPPPPAPVTIIERVEVPVEKIVEVPAPAPTGDLATVQAALDAEKLRVSKIKAKAIAHARAERSASLRFMYDIGDD